MVASAAVMTHRPEALRSQVRTEDWQERAWQFFDTVGELRFGVQWKANGMSRVNLVAARTPQHLGDEPNEIVPPAEDDEALPPVQSAAVDLVAAMAGGPSGQGQMLAHLATLLTVPGIGYLLMEPEMIASGRVLDVLVPPELNGDGDELVHEPEPDETWTWQVLSADELRAATGVYEVQGGPGEWRRLHEDFVLVKVWNPHPRWSWQADSPCKAVTSVLAQISLLDSHVSATAQSRLAGAGLLVLPAEAEFVPLPRTTSEAEPSSDDEPTEDDFIDVLVTTMTVPIGDRAAAAAVVPLVVRIPGEHADKVKHLTFWTEFSDALLPLRQAAVERLALGLDMPPEALTGVADVNHWTAWQVQESAVTLHIEPMAETICHACTIGYLRPALRAMGFGDEVDDLLVWYDTTDLTTRPDRSDDTFAAYDRLEASGAAVRREAGLSEADAPDEDELRRRLLTEIAKAQPMLTTMLLKAVGIDVRAEPPDEDALGWPVPSPEETTPPANGPPPRPTEPETAPTGPPAEQARVMLEACDALVHRALERAGMRLRTAAAKKLDGGVASIECADPVRLHVELQGVTPFASLEHLLANAWTRVPDVAVRLGLDADALTATLDAYTRALLATGHAHDADRLADALGLALHPA
jgi:hypothetical protein